MIWDKLGLIKSPSDNSWKYSHAYIPTPILQNNVIRVLVSFWDKNNIGRIGYIDLDAKNPLKILNISETPSLDVGTATSFDCKGVTPMSYLYKDNILYLLYTGWGNHNKYPYTLFTGLAISNDNGKTFSRVFTKPLLSPTENEPTIRTAAYIIFNEELNEYWIWYVGGKEWFMADNKLTPTYNLKLIRSLDLFNWEGIDSTTVMEIDKSLNEYAIGRPCIIKNNKKYSLYYSSRQYDHGYRLGYAESNDGYHWERKDTELGIALSQIGWDSKMMCFSYILPTPFGTYMFYNGNEHGKDGFGIAKLRK